MERLFSQHNHQVPGLNTASLPDLIFTVLFFFMIVTHMRRVTLRVKYQMPEGKELTQLARKTTTTYICVGRPISAYQHATNAADTQTDGTKGSSDGMVIQVNDKIVPLQELADALPKGNNGREACIKADRQTPMWLIMEIKQALRKAGILHINYSGTIQQSLKK